MSQPALKKDWGPFSLITAELRADAARSWRTREGIGDRLRTAAFAEIQAREAFLWAARNFQEVPPKLRDAWEALAVAEDRHLNWLLNRMSGLGLHVRERPVSDRLFDTLVHCPNAKDFAHFMAAAETRGRDAGLLFCDRLADIDPETSEIFGKIADEEKAHIALAARFF